MDVRTMKRMAKLVEWCERVHACRTSGMSVTKWCEQNRICMKTYYRWERACLAEDDRREPIPAEQSAQGGQLVRIDPNQLREAAEDRDYGSAEKAGTNAGITLRYGGMSVEMPAGMDVAQIAVLMKTLR